ncbi:MAG: FAD-binding protein [Acidimicrobiia bacterium]|nr:FAD-binding protein [Acidimicrobiia bacterium]
MTSIKVALARLAERMQPQQPGLPEAEITAAPETTDQLAALLAQASAAGTRTLIWGGGTHQGYGGRVTPDLLLVTTRLQKVVAWEPEDLTVVVEGGATVAWLEEQLSARSQTAVLPEQSGPATVGGVMAGGVSGYRRGRYGPTRDRILEVTLVTGDGRVVRGGGRVVKNVTGYDLPRLAVGSLGSLGVIASVCLKLWPLPAATATVTVDDPERAMGLLHRPLAVLSDRRYVRAYLSGTEAEVEAQLARLGGEMRVGLHWPEDPPGETRWSIRVPPSHLQAAISRLPTDWSYVAQHGVGVVDAGAAGLEAVVGLRAWVESVGGSMVLVGGPVDLYAQIDPWGTAPAALDLQRRLLEAFDPSRILNPGRLPGGL